MKTQKTYQIQDITPETTGVYTYRFQFDGQRMHFLPGQFVVAQRQSAGKKASVTFSSRPGDPEGFSLTLKRMGEFGTEFCDNAKVGDAISMVGPTGPFAIDIYQRKPICFLGRDYSVSAARSALLEREGQRLQEGKIPRGKFFMMHELSAPEEQLFAEDFQGDAPGFFYLPVLDPAYVGPTRDFPKSRLTAEFIQENIPDLRSTDFYICAEGVDAKFYKAELGKLGIPKTQIHVERWS